VQDRVYFKNLLVAYMEVIG